MRLFWVAFLNQSLSRLKVESIKVATRHQTLLRVIERHYALKERNLVILLAY